MVGLCCAAGTAARAADVDIDPGIAGSSSSAPTSTSLSSPASPGISSAPFSLGDASVRLGDLRALVTGLDSEPPVPRPLTLTPSIGIQEVATDNVLQVASPKRADLITLITPSIALSGDTSRVSANLYYSPSAQLYARTSQQDQVAQNFGGQALLTVVKDFFFIDFRGSGSQQSTNNSTPLASTTSPFLSNNNRVQDTTLEVSPYVTQRFGGDFTAKVGYVGSYSSETTGSGVNTQPGFNTQSPFITQSPFLNNPFNQNIADQTTWTNEEYATFTTGENFGRFNDSLRLDASQTVGTGVLDDSRRTTAIDYFSYALNRKIALLGSGGYEDIKFDGVPPIAITDAVWSGGVRLTPNQDSTITVSYGHKDGFNSASVDIAYSLTARTRVFANYHEGLTSTTEELQDNLANSTVDQFGNTLDAITGAPLMISDSLLAQQDSLYRLKQFTATIITALERDTISLSLEDESRTVVSTAVGANQGAFSDQGASANLSWTHELTPVLSATASLQYATTTTKTVPSTTEQSVSVGVQTAYAFSPSLTGNAQYFATTNSANTPQGSYLQNVILIGLSKRF
jgi:uncharacterized protein (PEP-CTERM system associated)